VCTTVRTSQRKKERKKQTYKQTNKQTNKPNHWLSHSINQWDIQSINQWNLPDHISLSQLWMKLSKRTLVTHCAYRPSPKVTHCANVHCADLLHLPQLTTFSHRDRSKPHSHQLLNKHTKDSHHFSTNYFYVFLPALLISVDVPPVFPLVLFGIKCPSLSTVAICCLSNHLQRITNTPLPASDYLRFDITVDQYVWYKFIVMYCTLH